MKDLRIAVHVFMDGLFLLYLKNTKWEQSIYHLSNMLLKYSLIKGNALLSKDNQYIISFGVQWIKRIPKNKK